MLSRKIRLAVTGALALSTAVVVAQASDRNRPPVGFGNPISETDLELWNIDIHTPSGGGLPPGEGTVSAGREV